MGIWFSSSDEPERVQQPLPTPTVEQVPVQEVNQVFEDACSNSNIAAIDFGTTSVSLAYTTVGYEGINTLKFDNTGSYRVSNAVLFKKELGDQISVAAFGGEARKIYPKQRTEDYPMQIYMYFERIKMLMKKEKSVNRDTVVDSFIGEEFYLVEVIAFILKYLKEQLIEHLKLGIFPLTTTDFDWVITVPAIWDARGKRMMREAAYMAGLLTESGGITQFTPVSSCPLPRPDETNPHKLSLALEPEVAALYSQEVISEGIEWAGSQAAITRPSQYMLIDIGGGTVDITAHVERDGGIVVENIPTGNDWGGTKVNEAFSKMLQKIVKDENFENFVQQQHAKNTGAVNKLVYVNFEEQKILFGRCKIDREIAVELPNNFIVFYSLKAGKLETGVEFKDDILYISKEVVETRFFGPTLEGITECVLQAIKSSGYKMDTFYLVGGFGGCKYIHHKIQNAIEEAYCSKGHCMDCPVIVPTSPDLAVAQGAVMWRKNPEIVKARRVDATYGIETTQIPFNSSIHDEYYRFYNFEEHIFECKSCYSIFIEKGDLAKATDKPKTQSYTPSRQGDTKVAITFYSTPNIGVKYTKDKNGRPTVTKIGELVIDTPNPNNVAKNKRIIDVSMDFSSTEIKATAKYHETGKEVNIVCDFLSKI